MSWVLTAARLKAWIVTSTSDIANDALPWYYKRPQPPCARIAKMPLEGFNALPNFICFNNASGGTNLALSRLVPRSAGLEGKGDFLTVVTIAIPYH
eukprot:scaffold32628_cov54-Attheya_sp.AAC.1